MGAAMTVVSQLADVQRRKADMAAQKTRGPTPCAALSRVLLAPGNLTAPTSAGSPRWRPALVPWGKLGIDIGSPTELRSGEIEFTKVEGPEDLCFWLLKTEASKCRVTLRCPQTAWTPRFGA
jgi:hypothetical protein